MNTLTRVIFAIVAILGVTLGLTACSSDDPAVDWSSFNLSNDGAVENLDCVLFDTSKGYDEQPARGPIWQTLTAIADNDTDALKSLYGSDAPSDEAKQKVRDRLDARLKGCKPGDEQRTDVTGTTGGLQQLPVVQGGDIVRGDSTASPETPSVVPADAIEKCGTLATWQSLVDCMGSQQWYIDGINQMQPYTGFNWEDVKKWGMDSKGFDARVIQVYNLEISDVDARSAVRSLIGEEAAKTLQIVRNGDFVNTRGLEEGKLSPFLDRKRQVRVSLAPLVYANGKPSGMRSDAGVFVDCLNVWAIPKSVGTVPPNPARDVPPPPSNPPGTVPPPSSPPPSSPPPPPPPVITTTPPPPPPPGKLPTVDPYPRGNAPQGGGQNATPGPGVAQPYTPPPATPYTPPPAPAYTPPPAPPVITQQPAAPQPPVVVPSQQPPNNGTIVPQPGGDFG